MAAETAGKWKYLRRSSSLRNGNSGVTSRFFANRVSIRFLLRIHLRWAGEGVQPYLKQTTSFALSTAE